MLLGISEILETKKVILGSCKNKIYSFLYFILFLKNQNPENNC